MSHHPLNPEAGYTPMPDDPEEIAAALEAGAISHRKWPYYRLRYGERGLRFAHSDSAWLVTLARMPLEEAHHQAKWLGDVLSNRGMPTLLLEEHLRVLERVLTRRFPVRTDTYTRLGTLARHMQSRHRAAMRHEDAVKLPIDFALRVGRSAHPWLIGTGRLLVGAVVDERLGVKNAVPSLTKWFCHPERFDASWVHHVEALIAEARGARWGQRC